MVQTCFASRASFIAAGTAVGFRFVTCQTYGPHLGRQVTDLKAGRVMRDSATEKRTTEPSVLRGWLGKLGPGVIAGAADDDPSGIATYSIAGAQYGTELLWTAWFTWPLMAFVQ